MNKHIKSELSYVEWNSDWIPSETKCEIRWRYKTMPKDDIAYTALLIYYGLEISQAVLHMPYVIKVHKIFGQSIISKRWSKLKGMLCRVCWEPPTDSNRTRTPNSKHY